MYFTCFVLVTKVQGNEIKILRLYSMVLNNKDLPRYSVSSSRVLPSHDRESESNKEFCLN